MKVQGHEITQEQIDACLARMKKQPFQLYQLVSAMYVAGVHGNAVERFADRMIQRERKAGNIALRGRDWEWIGKQ